MKEEKKTNKLEYYVPKNERTLRELHLMFAKADFPDRMSNIAQGLSYAQVSQYLVDRTLYLLEARS